MKLIGKSTGKEIFISKASFWPDGNFVNCQVELSVSGDALGDEIFEVFPLGVLVKLGTRTADAWVQGKLVTLN